MAAAWGRILEDPIYFYAFSAAELIYVVYRRLALTPTSMRIFCRRTICPSQHILKVVPEVSPGWYSDVWSLRVLLIKRELTGALTGNRWWGNRKDSIRSFAADYCKRLKLDMAAEQKSIKDKLDRLIASVTSPDGQRRTTNEAICKKFRQYFLNLFIREPVLTETSLCTQELDRVSPHLHFDLRHRGGGKGIIQLIRLKIGHLWNDMVKGK